MATKYYAVLNGRVPGIYETWEECSKNVTGYSGAKFKSFATKDEALEYLGLPKPVKTEPEQTENHDCQASDTPLIPMLKLMSSVMMEDNTIETDEADATSDIDLPKHTCAFVDGSFNAKESIYGYGAVIVYPNVNGKRPQQELTGWDDNPEMASMRNVAGEITGALKAIENVYKNGYREITIFYDYEGIGAWADGYWQSNKVGTVAYKEAIARYRFEKGMTISFIHVKGHSGVQGNEQADRLAKKAVGIE